jgi:hypothetical protein
LKTGAIGALGSLALASPASANNGKGKGNNEKDTGNNYGNGKGIGAFLNEKPKWNDHPWGDGVVNKTGEENVEVTVGALTTINPPFPPSPTEAPFAFDPMAVKVSPGTTVTWRWATPHHSVTSYNPEAGDPSDPTTTGDHGQKFDDHDHGGPPHQLSYTFEERGAHLYFCHPHGTPYPAYDAFLESVPGIDPIQENLLGMRGAVLVAGKPN